VAAVAAPLVLRPSTIPGATAAVEAGATGDDADLAVAPADAARPWRAGRPMSQRRSYVAAAEVDGRIYAAGGMVGESGRRLQLLQRYDPAADAWTGLANLPVPTRAAAAAAVGRSIYLIGGDAADGNGRQVWRYDVDRDRWTRRAPLPRPRFNHAAVALDGRIYVLGGYQDGRELDEMFVYDPQADRWTSGVDLPLANHAFGATVLDGELWMIGGRVGERVLDDVWIFDPRAGRWRAGPRLPRPMELLGASAAGRDIHAVWEATYQIYDGASGRWRDGPSPQVHRHGLSVFHVDRRLYAIGGCTTALRDSQALEIRALS
jgi:N-acetylneuraminic acid mutarotase